MRFKVILSFVVGFILLSCASSTQLIDIYADESFAGKELKKILVLGIAKEDWKKKVYENEFRTQLMNYNVKVLTAWQELPSGEELNKETFEKYFKDKNVDAVLVAIAGGESVDATIYKGGAAYVTTGFYGFYVSTSAIFYSPDYSMEEKSVNMTTNLYETKDAKLIWSAKSKSYEPKNTGDVIKKVSKEVVGELYIEGYIN
jgi:hypothetical protein